MIIDYFKGLFNKLTTLGESQIVSHICKQVMFFAFVLLTACNAVPSEKQEISPSNQHYNVCLVLDGTDRLSEQNGVPCITTEDLVGVAETLSNRGVGCLYVGYVDNNCDNNRIALFEWSESKPAEFGEKPNYMKMANYKDSVNMAKDKISAYQTQLEASIDHFRDECAMLCKIAYSESVARPKRGSDVNGAINQADRLLSASQIAGEASFIILVSDGCDNVGKKLTSLPPSTELLIVNSNVSKHQYGDLVSKEFVTLKQAINYIF